MLNTLDFPIMNGLLRVRRKSSQVCFLDTWQHLFSPVMLTLLYVELLSPEAIAHFICSSKMRLQVFRVSYNLFHFNVFWFVFFVVVVLLLLRWFLFFKSNSVVSELVQVLCDTRRLGVGF